MDATEVKALRMMRKAFPELPPEVEDNTVSSMTRDEAVPFLVHHNTFPVVVSILKKGLNSAKGQCADVTVGSIMDMLSRAAMDWYDLGKRGTFRGYAEDAVEGMLHDGAVYLTWKRGWVSVDAPVSEGTGRGRDIDTVANVVDKYMDRSYAAGLARSIKGVVEYDRSLDAEIVRRDRKVAVIRDVRAVPDTGYAAAKRRAQERNAEKASPVRSTRWGFDIRVVIPSKRVRGRWTLRIYGMNPTHTRYCRAGKLVPVSGHEWVRRKSIGPGFARPETDPSTWREFSRELPSHCLGCMCFPACSTWTVSGARFFTRGLHKASVCPGPLLVGRRA